MTVRRVLLFAFLAALLATLLTDYRYAEVGLEEIDPMVRRAIDPGFLANDFFTNTTAAFGPRFYFARFIAAISTPQTLPATYFMLTLAINTAIAAITAMFSTQLFKSSVSGMFSAALVMGAASLDLGGTGQAHAKEPSSHWMSFPFVIAAVWAATRGRPLLTGALVGLASILHPSFGPAVGGMTFGAMVLGLVLRRQRGGAGFPALAVGGGLLLFGGLLAAVLIPYWQEPGIPEQQMLDILLLRAPHHLVPSTFETIGWVKAALFIVAVLVAWRWLQRTRPLEPLAATVLRNLAALLIMFFICGYLFVEVWPWTPWFLAVPFRATSFSLWLGLVMIGGVAAARANGAQSGGEWAPLQLGSFNAVASGPIHLLVEVKARRWLPPPAFLAGVVLAVAAGVLTSQPRDLAQFVLISGLGAWFLFAPDRGWVVAAGVAAPLALAGALIAFQSLSHTPSALDRVGPEIFPSHVEGPEAAIAGAARQLTPADAVILTPPSFGSFRVLAQRAIVVDTRTIPYQEVAMAEWMDRIVTVYGLPSAAVFEGEDLGREGLESLATTYLAIDDETIEALCARYPLTHAVLFGDTPTAYRLLEENDTYQLVALDGCAS